MKIKVAILKETKTPPDKRAVFSPELIMEFHEKFPQAEIYVQRSDIRSYKDEEYEKLGFKMCDTVDHCELLLGIKEVSIPQLIPDKTYMFFSHTAKKQEYNRSLLKELLKRRIKMIDYEYLTAKEGYRLVAFGRWAGVVGAYNALIAYGQRNNIFNLQRAIDCYDVSEMESEMKAKVKLPYVKILLTGDGRVANGAIETISKINIRKVSPQDFLTKQYNEPVYTQLTPKEYVQHKDGKDFELKDFFQNPQDYVSSFLPYTKVADVFMACHFWDNRSPVFFTKEDAAKDDFKISIIADISCDIAIPIPTTLRSSEIAKPYYGYNKRTGLECEPFEEGNITVMAVDNLPGELPRDASVDFGKALIDKIFPYIFEEDTEKIIERATITENGKLGKNFIYLEDFVK